MCKKFVVCDGLSKRKKKLYTEKKESKYFSELANNNNRHVHLKYKFKKKEYMLCFVCQMEWKINLQVRNQKEW